MDDAWWINHIFGQRTSERTNPDAAALENAVPREDALGFMTRLFAGCGKLLAPFAVLQVAEGLTFFAAGERDWPAYLCQEDICRPTRVACVRSIETLFRDCLARRCRETSQWEQD